jgi:DHA2 family multidrug resistance protein
MGGLGGAAMAVINGEVNRQALMIAFLDNFYLLSWVLLAFAPLPLLLKKPQKGAAIEKLPIME